MLRWLRRGTRPMALAAVAVGGPVWADNGGGIDTGDTAFILVSAALVLLMTPGLALFYGGMVRRKNVLGTIMHSFVMLGLVSIQWVLWGYSLSFGADIGGGVLGNLQYLGLRGVGLEPQAGSTIPHQLFMVFQMMFAIITVALISGAWAERMKFSAFMVFALLWTTLVYDPICHWVWGPDGWLGRLGALDFAGGTVVHISSGVSALVAALVIGKRRNLEIEPPLPHNLTMTITGTGLLWFGWFGFNAGSALAANGAAVGAFVTTNTAAAAAALTWMVIDWTTRGRPTALGVASGAVAGLVGITPAAGFVTPMGALAIGITVSVVCYLAVTFKARFGYDDSLDVFGIHGMGGTWGALATGLFASAAVGGVDGVLYGNAAQIAPQIAGVVATWVYAGLVSFVLLKLIDATIGLRVGEDEEEEGLDISQHDESGYVL